MPAWTDSLLTRNSYATFAEMLAVSPPPSVRVMLYAVDVDTWYEWVPGDTTPASGYTVAAPANPLDTSKGRYLARYLTANSLTEGTLNATTTIAAGGDIAYDSGGTLPVDGLIRVPHGTKVVTGCQYSGSNDVPLVDWGVASVGKFYVGTDLNLTDTKVAATSKVTIRTGGIDRAWMDGSGVLNRAAISLYTGTVTGAYGDYATTGIGNIQFNRKFSSSVVQGEYVYGSDVLGATPFVDALANVSTGTMSIISGVYRFTAYRLDTGAAELCEYDVAYSSFTGAIKVSAARYAGGSFVNAGVPTFSVAGTAPNTKLSVSQPIAAIPSAITVEFKYTLR